MARAVPCGFLALLVTACGPPARQARFTLHGCSAAPVEGVRLTFGQPPVLSPASAPAWDSVDVLNPSVARWDGRYLLLYSGFDGETWHTGAAWSPDGDSWDRASPEPVLSPQPDTWEGDYIAANGSLVAHGGHLLYWYQAGLRNAPSIGLAQSADGVDWQRVNDAPVFTPGARGAWDEAAVADPYVVACTDVLYLFYLGQDRHGRQRLGLARSADGVRWQRSDRNPILELGGRDAFDERGLGEPAVLRTPDGWRMLYTGRDSQERRRMGWAHSQDGLRWEKRGPILSGQLPWNEAVVCDATFLVEGAQLSVWYGGGSVPSPDENLSGAIGRAR